MTEQEQIDAGKRVQSFLADDAVKGALVKLEKRYIADFKASKSPEEREAIHARVTALDDLFTSVLGIVDNGTLAQHARAAREAEESRKRTPRSR